MAALLVTSLQSLSIQRPRIQTIEARRWRAVAAHDPVDAHPLVAGVALLKDLGRAGQALAVIEDAVLGVLAFAQVMGQSVGVNRRNHLVRQSDNLRQMRLPFAIVHNSIISTAKLSLDETANPSEADR